MKINPRLRTRNAKFALLYAFFFGTVTLLAVTIVVQHWTNLSKREIRAALNESILGLQDVLSNEGDIGLRREIESRIQSKTDPDALYALWSSRGIFIAGNVSPTFNLPTPGLKEIEFELSADPNTHDEGHAVIALATVLVNGSVLLIGRDVQSHMKLRRESLWVIVSILALMAILGFFGAVLSHRRALKQLNALVVTTSRIANGDLSQRVARSGDADGFDRLAVAVNAMLENIEALTSGMQTVVDAVAHDLRRPLTHARQALETAQLSCQNSADDATLVQLTHVDRALARIQHTLDALLLIVQVEAGTKNLRMAPCALDALARDVFDLYEPIAESMGVALVLSAPAPITRMAHRQLLSHAVINLLDNALKYAPMGKRVELSVESNSERAGISVTDHGPGIAPADRSRVTERFVRLVSDDDVPGSGLGLSLVAAVARLHAGVLVLSDARPGLRACIELPTASEPVQAML